jgi:hypothetical protein
MFVFNNFLNILLNIYTSVNPDDQYEGSEALYNIVFKFMEQLFGPGEGFHLNFFSVNKKNGWLFSTNSKLIEITSFYKQPNRLSRLQV